jgi:hypothetical protein
MPGTVFISYSKADKVWRERLQAALGVLETCFDVEVWADDRIDAGDEWYKEISEAIDRSGVAILLLSEKFLGTGFIMKEEVPELLRRQEALGMKLIPLLIHDCPWKAVRWLRALNIVPEKATPLITYIENKQDTFLARMTEEIADFLETWQPAAEPVEAEAPVTATIDISHLPETSSALFGRDAELDALDADWENADIRVLALVADGGVG